MHKKTIGLVVAMLLAMPVVMTVSAEDSEKTFIVGLTGPPGHAKGDTFHGATVTGINDAIDFITVTSDDPPGFMQRAQHDPKVRYVSEDSDTALGTLFTPNDPMLGQQWGFNPSPGISAFNAFDVTTGSTGVVVAVLDTGLDKSHPDIGNYLQGWDFSNGDNEPEDLSQCGHGTHVAGTVGAIANNGIGVAGVAQTTILPVKVLEYTNPLYGCTGSFADIANGITWSADQGADIISMSLGCFGCSDQSVIDAIDYATAAGSLVIVAAGNDGANSLGFPANVANAMSVAAHDSNGNKASFSNYGSGLDITGPGVGIVSTTGGGYATWDGTSMATPHVSGVAALVLAAGGSYTPQQLRDHLKNTASDLGMSANQQGAGAVNACAAVGGVNCGGGGGGGGGDLHTHDIDHWRTGSAKKGDVFIQVWSSDAAEAPMNGVSVTIDVSKAGGGSATGTASTGSDGSVTFKWARQGSGTYTSCVTGMSLSGYTWDSAAGHAANGNCETEAV